MEVAPRSKCLSGVEWMDGYPLDCYDYKSTYGANNMVDMIIEYVDMVIHCVDMIITYVDMVMHYVDMMI